MSWLRKETDDSSASGARDMTDVILALLVAVVELAVLFACWHTVGVQSDESVNIYGALRMLEGERIYRDFWVYHTPGIFFLTAAVFSIFGKMLFSIRAVLFLTAAIAAAALYLLGRKFMGRIPSLLAPLLFIAIGVNLWGVAGYHWYGTLILVFSTFFAARFIEDRSRVKSLFTSGILAGLTFLFQQPKGGYLICLMFLFLMVEAALRKEETSLKSRMLRSGSIFIAGVGAPILITTLYFALAGTLREAVSASIVFPIRLLSESGGEEGFAAFYGTQTENVLFRIVTYSSFLGNARWAIWCVAALIKYIAPLSIPLAFGVWIIRRKRGSGENTIPVLCSVTALAAFGSALQRPDFYHLLTILPPCYLALAYVIQCRLQWERSRTASFIGTASGLTLVAVLLVSSARIAVADLFYASRIQAISLGSPLGFLPELKRANDWVEKRYPLEAVIDYIHSNSSPEEKIFVMSYTPFIYYLSGRRNVTRYIDIPSSPCGENLKFHVFKLGEASFNRKRLEDVVRALDADGTRIVVLDSAAACQVREGYEEVASGDDPLIDYLRAHYYVAVDYNYYVVMLRSG